MSSEPVREEMFEKSQSFKNEQSVQEQVKNDAFYIDEKKKRWGELYKAEPCRYDKKNQRNVLIQELVEDNCRAVVMLSVNPCIFGQCENKKTKGPQYCSFHDKQKKIGIPVFDYSKGTNEGKIPNHDDWLESVFVSMRHKLFNINRFILMLVYSIRQQINVMSIRETKNKVALAKQEALLKTLMSEAETRTNDLSVLQQQLNDSKSALTILNQMFRENNELLERQTRRPKK